MQSWHPLASNSSFVAPIPSCALCLDTLGRHGGPATLPCGHNACRDCLNPVLARPSPRCPLCRTHVPAELTSVSVNHELRDLVALATMLYLDEREQQEGWEAFPDTHAAARSYKDDVKQHLESQQQLATAAWHAEGGMTDGVAPARGSLDAASGGSQADRDVLALEPPQWLPDSFASACGGCHLQFRPITRLKHHCRMCGKIFCHSCCHKRMLLPPKFAVREPQRVCELCSSLLAPLQPFLAGTQAAAVQPAVHDSIDSVSLRSWLNSPWSSSLEGDIYKGANILHTFTRAMRLHQEQSLPLAVLQGCRALVLLSSVKVGAGWSCSFGTGLAVARSPGGGWSAPCAVACCGMGWGLQFGGELADLVLVLRSEEQLTALCAGTQLGLGGDLGLAVGLMGRHADAAVMLGMRGATSPMFSYSCSKGAFVGAALQGTVMLVRSAVNEKFYGYCVNAAQLLLEDSVPQPPAATMLYDALHTLSQKYEMRSPLTPAQLQQYDAPRSQLAASTAPQLQGVAQPGQQQQQGQPQGQLQGQPLHPDREDSSVAAASAGVAHQAPPPPLAVASAVSNNSSDAGQHLPGVSQQPQPQSHQQSHHQAHQSQSHTPQPQQDSPGAMASLIPWSFVSGAGTMIGGGGANTGGAAAPSASAPVRAPAYPPVPDWTASGTFMQTPAFLLQPAAPSAPPREAAEAEDALEGAVEEQVGAIAALPSAPTTRVAAPQITSRPRAAQEDDEEVPYGVLFD